MSHNFTAEVISVGVRSDGIVAHVNVRDTDAEEGDPWVGDFRVRYSVTGEVGVYFNTGTGGVHSGNGAYEHDSPASGIMAQAAEGTNEKLAERREPHRVSQVWK